MTTTSSKNDPYSAFNVIVDIDGMTAGFAEVAGLGTEKDIVEFREGNRSGAVRKLPGMQKYVNLTLKRGFSTSRDLWEWRKRAMDGTIQRRPGTITLLDRARQPALVWKFSGSWPSKWVGPAFNAEANDVAIEELEIAVEGLELK